MAVLGLPVNRRRGVVSAMTSPRSAFSLPQNYGFNDLAGYEESRRGQFGQDAQRQIMDARSGLATSLATEGQNRFKMANPMILEDLNRRGLLTSPSEVANSQAQVLKEIELENQGVLRQYDAAALNAKLQAEQDALDSGLDLRRGDLEQRLGDAAASREEALARDLARQQGRNSLYSSLIRAGGQIGSGLLMSKLMGGGSLFGGGATAAGGMAAGLLPLAGVGAGVGAGLGLYEAGRKMLRKQGFGKTTSKVLSAVPGAGLSIGVANKAVKSVSKSIKKAFCFDPLTPIEMADGTTKVICRIRLGDQTSGGVVESVRISMTDDGTVFDYRGVTVTGSHAVKEEGKWIRVKDSTASIPLTGKATVVSICTSDHRVFVKGVEFADEIETDHYEDLSIEESLAELNKQELVEVA